MGNNDSFGAGTYDRWCCGRTAGDNASPSRLTHAALGAAGTILREGTNIKGLTTAAGLWSVACMGLLAGAGFYSAAIVCAVFVLLVLTIVDRLQHRLRNGKNTGMYIRMECRDASQALLVANRLAQQYSALILDIEVDEVKTSLFSLRYKVLFQASNRQIGFTKYVAELSDMPNLVHLSTEEL